MKTIKTSGTILPSSRFLAKSMLKEIDFSNADVLVELGPGNGIITEQILSKLHKNAILICFEINTDFYKHLLEIKNTQLIVLNTSAEFIEQELQKLGFDKADHIISSLPLTNIPKQISKVILNNAYHSLQKEGLFIQFQYSLTYYKKLKSVFKEAISLSFEARNIPPAFIYRCTKK